MPRSLLRFCITRLVIGAHCTRSTAACAQVRMTSSSVLQMGDTVSSANPASSSTFTWRSTERKLWSLMMALDICGSPKLGGYQDPGCLENGHLRAAKGPELRFIDTL